MESSLAMKNLQRVISNKYRTSVNDVVRVCFYGRVSTQHEAQMNALDNQIQWYDSILADHPNWEKVGVYVDRGVTGTQAKKRQGFMQMIEDASSGKFDLICTREVSRFARNTLDSLNYTRQLARMGVEVFFYNDNIWSCESDGELRLTIMSAMSQEEARHISDRVLAGQSISRQKGVLYGNGNILGYTLVKGKTSSENTYAIVEEDAETVRMIYDYYLEGMGAKAIARKMQELHRETAKSGCKWDATKVLRILNNKTYAGYIGYNKSYTTSFLDHTRVNVKDRSQYEYVKGNFPAIISEEKWDRVQLLKSQKLTYTDDGAKGKRRSADKWTRVLRCECGKTYKRYKWRTNQSGESYFGYQCQNQVQNGKKSFRIANHLDAEGYCDIPSICEWKLDFMLKNILSRIWNKPKETVTVLVSHIADNYTVEKVKVNSERGRLQREHNRLKCREERLLDMMLDNQIGKETFESKQKQLRERMDGIERLLQETGETDSRENREDVSHAIAGITEVLENACELDSKQVSENLVDSLVTRITPTQQGIYRWYLNTSLQEEEFHPFVEEEYILYDTFTLDFEQAKNYRKKFGNYIRASQWRDLNIEVNIRK